MRATTERPFEVHYKGKTIADVLDMPIEEGLEFFAAVPAIARHLQTLVDVGLGYVRLGQPAPTLSGERHNGSSSAQSCRSAPQVARSMCLMNQQLACILRDIRKLLLVLGRLVDQGNSVVVIEHNLDVIKCADWVIDMGPGRWLRWGTVVATGTPEDVALVKTSPPGSSLRSWWIRCPSSRRRRSQFPAFPLGLFRSRRRPPRRPQPRRPQRRPQPKKTTAKEDHS